MKVNTMTQQNAQIDIEDYIASSIHDELSSLNTAPQQKALLELIEEPEIPSIAHAAVLVRFRATSWAARLKDKQATRNAEIASNASRGAANLTKNLLVNCDELRAIHKFITNVRDIHRSMSMTWSDGGERLVPTAQYPKYLSTMTALQDEFYVLVDNFMAVYDWQAIDTQAKLGAMFNPAEYPSASEVRAKFSFQLSYDMLADGGNTGDWRLDLPHEQMSELRNSARDGYFNNIKGAMDSVWHRTHETLTTLVRQLDVNEEGKGNKLYDSVFDRAVELVAMMGTCNVTGDSQMEAMRRKLEDTLHGLTLPQIKNSPSLREDTRSKLTAAIAALPSLDM